MADDDSDIEVKARIRNVGGSAVITLPVDLLAILGWDIGDKLHMSVTHDSLDCLLVVRRLEDAA